MSLCIFELYQIITTLMVVITMVECGMHCIQVKLIVQFHGVVLEVLHGFNNGYLMGVAD